MYQFKLKTFSTCFQQGRQITRIKKIKIMKLTFQIIKGNNFFIGKIKEIPAVLTQGKSIEEVKENILDALELYLTDMREN